MELIKKHMTARVASRTISPELKLKIRNHLGLEPEANPLPVPSQERVKCVYCPKRKNRKTTVRCAKCEVPICGEHTVTVCMACHNVCECKEK